jgi:hypothetical protein
MQTAKGIDGLKSHEVTDPEIIFYSIGDYGDQ